MDIHVFTQMSIFNGRFYSWRSSIWRSSKSIRFFSSVVCSAEVLLSSCLSASSCKLRISRVIWSVFNLPISSSIAERRFSQTAHSILRPMSVFASELLEAESQRSAEAIRGQNQEAEKGRNRSQESRHSCGGHCKGSVRPCQQFTAERAAERDADSVNIACR